MNHLWIVLDSVSYKVFVESESPNFRRLGPVEMVYAHGCWSLPAIMGMLYVPYLCGKPLVSVKYRDHRWLPVVMQEEGYHTTLVSDNPWFEIGEEYISKGFSNYISLGKLGCSGQLVSKALNHLTEPFFMVLWFTATHKPHFYPDKQSGLTDLVHKVNAIEHVDGLMGDFLKSVPSGTEVLVTSDHGNAWRGEFCLSHNPRITTVCQDTHYNIFYISGVI